MSIFQFNFNILIFLAFCQHPISYCSADEFQPTYLSYIPYVGKSLDLLNQLRSTKKINDSYSPRFARIAQLKTEYKIQQELEERNQQCYNAKKQELIHQRGNDEKLQKIKEEYDRIYTEIDEVQDRIIANFMYLYPKEDPHDIITYLQTLSEEENEFSKNWRKYNSCFSKYFGENNSMYNQRINYTIKSSLTLMGASLGFIIAHKIITPWAAKKFPSVLLHMSVFGESEKRWKKHFPYLCTGIITVLSAVISLISASFLYNSVHKSIRNYINVY